MKTVLFLPSFDENITTRNYMSVLHVIEAAGYQVRFVPIKWARTTILEWTAELDAVFSEYDVCDVILAGFGFGAMTAFLSAARRNPSALWLFSMSPYFSEDIHSQLLPPAWMKKKGQRRIAAFDSLIFNGLASGIKCPTILMYTDREVTTYAVTRKRLEAAKKEIRGSKVYIVKKVDHDITASSYLAKIKRVIQ